MQNQYNIPPKYITSLEDIAQKLSSCTHNETYGSKSTHNAATPEIIEESK